MRRVARSELQGLYDEVRRNLRFCVRAAAVLLLAHVVLTFVALPVVLGRPGTPPGTTVAVPFTILWVVAMLALLLGVTATAAIYPLLRQSGRLARVLEVARRSQKESVDVPPIVHPLADSLRVIATGMFVIWWFGIVLVELPMESAYMFGFSWPTVPGIDWSGTFVFVAYVAWLIADTALQSRRERALLIAWLEPVGG